MLYADGNLVCSPLSTETFNEGLWLYRLILRFPLGPHAPNRTASKGYYFRDGIVGEILALLSLFYRCRFYLISSVLQPSDPRSGMAIKTEFRYLRVPCDPEIHPPLFEDSRRNFTDGFSDFLDQVKALEPARHQTFSLACHHYARALKEVGVDPEMVFIRLVSAIETLSKGHESQAQGRHPRTGEHKRNDYGFLFGSWNQNGVAGDLRCQEVEKEVHPVRRRV